jgi:bifunctional non-homologous end joining protein LigD
MARTARQSPEELLRAVFPPMLASLVGGVPADEANWTYELKYDGFRAVSAISEGKIAIWSRNELDLASRFPSIARAVERIRIGEAVIDGEIVALDAKGTPRFQLLQQGKREVLFVFDLLWLEGRDTRQLPYEERRELLESLLRRSPAGVRLAERVAPPGQEALERVAKAGYEGLIAKLNGSRYDGRRSREWVKIKARNEQELAIIGYNPSTHSSKELGSLLLAVSDGHELQFAGRVGTGFSANLRRELKDELDRDIVDKTPVQGAPRIKDATWVKPRLVAQVHFTEWTEDGKLRHPSFLGLRPDKTPMECFREKPAEAPAEAETMKKPTSRSARAGPKAAPGTTPKSAVGRTTKRGAGDDKPAKATKRVAGADKSTKRAVAANTRTSGAKKTTSLEGSLKRASAEKGSAPAIVLTSPDRLLYPRDGITKQDVADYFAAVSDPLLKALHDRPLALEHWNQGIDKPSWFHQNLGRDAEAWLTRIDTPLRTNNRSVSHLVVDRPESLIWLAQRSALTIHMWSSRGDDLESPDWIVFDLDPAKGKGIEQAIAAALVMRRLLEHLDLPSVPKTSGKRGIHLFLPLKRGYSHEEAADFACTLSAAVAKEVPDVTMERSLASRRGRLYLDCLQNGYGKTIVAPYSPRAIDGAPVSAPLRWEEINQKLDPLKFTIRTMPKRLDKVGDLFAPALKGGVKLPSLK